MTLQNKNSVGSRFSFSLIANLLKAGISFVTGLIVARGLGPEQYGRMMFLLATFMAVRGLLDLGSSSAFFTFLSQRQRTKRFIGWFLVWIAVQFTVPILLVSIIFPGEWLEFIWNGEERSLVVMAFVVVFLQTLLWSVITQMGESQRLTRMVQAGSLIATFLHLILMIFAWLFGWLEIRLIYIAMIIEWSIAIGLVVSHLKFPPARTGVDCFSNVFNEFRHYCLPLIPYSVMGFAFEFTDRWMLQNYGGSVQQAYYSVAFQFSAIAGIASNSIINIFWKEVAEAHQNGNNIRVELLYRKVSRGLYFVSASAAGILIPWSDAILSITLGLSYEGGSGVLAIMFFYPILQTMGFVGGTMLYATGRIRAQVIIGMLFMVTSIVVSYFVLAPSTAWIPGFGLESIGLAGKMVIMAFLQVNITAFYLARSMHIKFDWVYQPIIIFGCLALGWLAYLSAGWFLKQGGIPVILQMFISGLIYLLLLAIFILWSPSLAGISRSDIIRFLGSVYPRMRRGD